MEQLLRYKVKGANATLNHSHVDPDSGERIQKMAREGDEVLLTYSQAIELKDLIEPLDDNAALPLQMSANTAVDPSFAAHEQEEILLKQLEELDSRRTTVQQQLDQVRARMERERAAREEAAKQAQPPVQETTPPAQPKGQPVEIANPAGAPRVAPREK